MEHSLALPRATYGYLADVIIAVHLAYVGYVVVGQVLILLGMALRWAWIRAAWFRVSHLIMIWIVAVEALCGIVCPLTTWEQELRKAADQPYSERTFVGRCMDSILFLNNGKEEAKEIAREQARQSTPSPTANGAAFSTSVTATPAPQPQQAPAVTEAEAEDADLTPWYVGFALLTTLTYALAPPRRRAHTGATDAEIPVVPQATP